MNRKPCSCCPTFPDVRRYQAIYVLNDAETGRYSDEVTVTCYPQNERNRWKLLL